MTSLTDGLDVGYERSQGDLLVFWPEQLGGDYWSISEWHKEGNQDFGFSQQSVECFSAKGCACKKLESRVWHLVDKEKKESSGI